MTWFLIKLGVRFLVFGLVFGLACHRMKSVDIRPRLALPLVALVFALLNTGVYWLAKPVLNLATLGFVWALMPLILNAAFLLITTRLLKYVRVTMELRGFLATVWLAALLTAAHGVLYVVFDMIAP